MLPCADRRTEAQESKASRQKPSEIEKALIGWQYNDLTLLSSSFRSNLEIADQDIHITQNLGVAALKDVLVGVNWCSKERRAMSRPPSEWVHIWVASLQQDRRTIEQLTSFLSLEEKAKATSFRFRYLQVRYQVRRGILRSILASYTGIPPSELKFSYSATGKPSLMNAANLEFNISDSEDLFACAVSDEAQVGIDIERIRLVVDLESLAQTALTLTESAWLMRQLPEDRLRSFFGVWTKKEALLKADGRGLSVDLRSFEINPDGPFTTPVRLRNDAERADVPYWISPFTPSPGYIGALAVNASPLKFTFREWKPR